MIFTSAAPTMMSSRTTMTMVVTGRMRFES